MRKPAKTNAERARSFRRRRAAAGKCLCGQPIGVNGTKTRCRRCADNLAQTARKRRESDPYYGKPGERKADDKWLEDNTLPPGTEFTPVRIPHDQPTETYNPVTKQWENQENP